MSFKRVKDIRSTRSEVGHRFTQNEKLKAINEVEQGVSRKEVCLRYGIAYLTLCNWLRDADSPFFLRGKNTRFSKKQKREIVRMVLDGTTTKEQACAEYNITKGLLWYWTSEFKKEEKLLAISDDVAMTQNVHTTRSNDELTLAKLKIKALETLIDVAEEQFKINIRKKPGAKQ